MTLEEHEQLKQASIQHGARCVSDFARAVLLRSAQPAQPPDAAAGNPPCAYTAIDSLDKRLSRVESDLDRLSDGLQTLLSNDNPNP